jgi:hypothetical protein
MTAVEEGRTQFDVVTPPGSYDLTASIQVSLAAQNPNGPPQQPQLMGTYYRYGSVDVTDRDVNVSVTMVPEAKTNVNLTIDGAPPAPALLPRISMSLLADSGAVALGVRRIRLDSNGAQGYLEVVTSSTKPASPERLISILNTRLAVEVLVIDRPRIIGGGVKFTITKTC